MGEIDERVERWILEDPPPLRRRSALVDLRIGPLDPARGERRIRTPVVGTDHAPGCDQGDEREERHRGRRPTTAPSPCAGRGAFRRVVAALRAPLTRNTCHRAPICESGGLY